MVDALRSRLRASEVTIQTTATAIPSTALTGRTSLVIKNTGSNTIYLGASDVTTAAGYPLAVNAELSLDIGESLILYGIVASGTETVRILEGV